MKVAGVVAMVIGVGLIASGVVGALGLVLAIFLKLALGTALTGGGYVALRHGVDTDELIYKANKRLGRGT